MRQLISSLKPVILVTASLAVFLMPLGNVYAKAGCCSGHKGVKQCDASTGLYLCKDGTNAGANCPCKKATASGCCSGHKGVAKCDTKTGFKRCNDKTLSSCECPKTK